MDLFIRVFVSVSTIVWISYILSGMTDIFRKRLRKEKISIKYIVNVMLWPFVGAFILLAMYILMYVEFYK